MAADTLWGEAHGRMLANMIVGDGRSYLTSEERSESRQAFEAWAAAPKDGGDARSNALAWVHESSRRDPVQAVAVTIFGAGEETHGARLSRNHQDAAQQCVHRFADREDDPIAKRTRDDLGTRDRFARLLEEQAGKAWRIVLEGWPLLDPPALTDTRTAERRDFYEQAFSEATRAVETPRGAVPWAAAAFAELLRPIGAKGAEIADRVLRKSAARLAQLDVGGSAPFPWTGSHEDRREWQQVHEALLTAPSSIRWGEACWWLWLQEEKPPRIYGYLAWALWVDVLRPQLDREARNPPALVIRVHEDVTRIYSRVPQLTTKDGQQWLTFDDEPMFRLAPSVADEMVQALVDRGVPQLGSVTAHKALRWQVVTGHERALRNEADARVLTIDGGWSVFAREILHLQSKADAETLRAIVYAQDAVQFTLLDGSWGRMLSLREWPARGRRKGRIELTLGTMLLPHYIYELPGVVSGRAAQEARRLIPVCGLPPFVGRPNDHGPQATLSMIVVQELRANARELVANGAVRIAPARFSVLARKAGLPPTLLGRVIDRWTQDGPDAPAFLARRGADLYTLAPTHRRELAFILAAGHTEVQSSEAGRRSVQARRARQRRVTGARG